MRNPRLLLAPAIGLAAATILGPACSQGDLQQKLKAKLQEPFVANAAWITDFDKAKAEAQRRGKQIFGYFTRSYAP